eukprot:8221479-Pyramimonas_sp.AAC.1
MVLDLSRSKAPTRTAGNNNDAGVWTTWGRSNSRISHPWFHGFDPWQSGHGAFATPGEGEAEQHQGQAGEAPASGEAACSTEPKLETGKPEDDDRWSSRGWGWTAKPLWEWSPNGWQSLKKEDDDASW